MKKLAGQEWNVMNAIKLLSISLALSVILFTQNVSALNMGSTASQINAYRNRNGLSSLNTHPLLNQSAQNKVNYMCKTDIWGHGNWSPFISNTGYKFSMAGENLAYGFTLESAMVTGWINSPTHNENLLRPNWIDQGFGVIQCPSFQGRTNVWIVANHFGEPMNKPRPINPVVPKPKIVTPQPQKVVEKPKEESKKIEMCMVPIPTIEETLKKAIKPKNWFIDEILKIKSQKTMYN